MKIIITGGTGLIGSALIAELAQEKNEIIVTSRAPEKATTLPPSVQVVEWDGKTAAGWGEHVEGADAIVNLAGEAIAPMPWLGDRKEKIRASRVNAGKAIVDAIARAKNKPRVVVQTSGVNYYGAAGGDAAITESSPQGNDFLASVAGDWEAATAPVEAMGVRRSIYRTGIVLTRRGGVLPMMSLPFQFFVGGKLGDGKQWLPWIHLADEVAGIQFLLANEKAKGVFNFVAPNPVRNQDFANALGHALKRPSSFPTPAFALKLAMGEMADELLLSGRRIVPERLKQLGFQFRFPTIVEALNDLYP